MSGIALPLRLLLGPVFLTSGVLKLVHWGRFHDTFSAMELFPRRFREGISRALPVLELALGLAVLTGWRADLAAPAVMLLLAGFVAGLAIYRMRGNPRLVCGCFADFEREQPVVGLIVRNLLLLGAAVLLWRSGPSAFAEDWREWLLAAAIALGSALSWMMLALAAEAVTRIGTYDAAEEAR